MSRDWWRGGYVKLLVSQGVSAIGDRISYVVVPFSLLMIGVSVSGLAVVLAARAVGYALVVLYSGVLADRSNRRRLMVISDVVRFMTQTATAALVFTGHAGVISFAILQLVFGAAEALFKPAAAGLMPELVPEAALERANGWLGSTVNTGMVAGPIMGGLLVGTGLGALGLAIDAATFAVSAFFLARLPRLRRQPTTRRSVFTDLREGWANLTRRRWLLILFVISALFELLSLSAVFSLGPGLAEESLGGPKAWGVLVTAFGLGGILGGVLATRMAPHRPAVWCAVLLGALSAQPLFLASGLPVVAISMLQFCAGASLTVYAVLSSTLVQRAVPRAVLSRIASFELLATTSLLPVGYLLTGGIAAVVGVAAAMQVVGVFTAVVCLLALASPDLRNLELTKTEVPNVP
ncbi:MFS transporter [Aldersonia sp. NBC_00410]|uniref:MFS transporter n=1 Tax=Aldersonia sp. NBC_00410 TaxID=2975954 RepID=UPI0022559651|nr:MFS transporter [Aldersonia sp. NBC_00410]MCX5042162.1 MFS transporter [Aldersonia sp. NBC_00410]